MKLFSKKKRIFTIANEKKKQDSQSYGQWFYYYCILLYSIETNHWTMDNLFLLMTQVYMI